MKLRMTSVYDEGAIENTSLIGAKGFAVMIEVDEQRILFDTGRRGRYLMHNFMFLDIKADDIDKVVISHGDADHTGGVEDLLRSRENSIEIYAPSSAMGSKRLIGSSGLYVPDDLKDKAEIKTIDDWIELSEHAFISRPMDIGNGREEVFMVITTSNGPAVVTACSHCGVDVVMEAVKERFGRYPRTYVGGVHIGKKEKQKAEAIATLFADRNCLDLHLNHCTGVNGIMYLRTVLGLKGVDDFYVGEIIEYDL